jgi:hypothetical protein
MDQEVARRVNETHVRVRKRAIQTLEQTLSDEGREPTAQEKLTLERDRRIVRRYEEGK